MINYVIGDATAPQGEGTKVIVHCVNDIGKWGSGFVVALNQRFGEATKIAYQQWHRSGNAVLGNVLFTRAGGTLTSDGRGSSTIWIANIVGQHETIRENPSPIRYRALRRGLETTAEFCHQLTVGTGAKVSLGGPRFGSGLAAGSWPKIEAIIEETFGPDPYNQIPVTIYDL